MMTHYDFNQSVGRRDQGSLKWAQMDEQVRNLPEEIVPFSVADTDLPPLPELVQGLKTFLDEMVLGYTGPTKAYYQGVINWFNTRHNWQVKEEWLIPTAGVVAALYQSVRAFSEPGDGVLILSPVYYPFRAAIEHSDREVIASSLVVEQGRYTIDFDDLEAKLKNPALSLMIFCSPHNPVGRVWTREELTLVDRLCRKHQVTLVSDEIHFDLILPGFEHQVFSTLSPEAQWNSVILTAPSKTFNVAGLQTANVVIANPDLRKKFQAQLAKDGQQLLNCIGPKACELVYRHGALWLEEFLELIEDNRLYFETFMVKELPQIRVVPLEGTYLQWFDCHGLGMSDQELNRFLVHDCQLFLDPGNLFGKEGDQYQRMSLACPKDDLRRALERLVAGVKAREGAL